jgi:hypothetical protein
VPAELQQTLLGGVNQLAARAPVCVPRVTPVAIAPIEPAITVRARGHDQPKHEKHQKHHGHGHGHGKGG